MSERTVMTFPWTRSPPIAAAAAQGDAMIRTFIDIEVHAAVVDGEAEEREQLIAMIDRLEMTP